MDPGCAPKGEVPWFIALFETHPSTRLPKHHNPLASEYELCCRADTLASRQIHESDSRKASSRRVGARRLTYDHGPQALYQDHGQLQQNLTLPLGSSSQ